MHPSRFLLCCLLACLAQATGATVDEVETIRENLRKALDYRDEAARELNQWRMQESEVESLTALASAELASLNATLKSTRDFLADLDDRRGALERRDEVRAAFEAMIAARLPPVIDRLDRLYQRWPEPLRSTTRARFELLNDTQTVARGGSPWTRKALDTAITILEAANDFQGQVNRSSLIHALPGGQESLYDVFYIGLAVGYYLSPETGEAGMILFREGQWLWQPDSALLEPLREFAAILDGSDQPHVVPLPVPAIAARPANDDS